MVLQGRDDERAELSRLADLARGGHAGVLVVLGEPGVGKSALLQDFASTVEAGDLLILRTQGIESESRLAFAALQRLFRPIAALIQRVPATQARALRVAFGQEEGAPVEPFLVGVATLSLLAEAAEGSPTCCIIDDAHWLDGPSADALLFASRRLQADRVVIVFAARTAPIETVVGTSAFRPVGLPVLLLGGLGDEAARQLLAQRGGESLPEEVAGRLLREAGGNPLALVELPAALSDAELHGQAPLPPLLELTAALERAFLDRCRRLPQEVQTLLLIAAADGTGRLATVRRAARDRGVAMPAWDAAERSGLLIVHGDVVAVRHPLVRSAVYQAATNLERGDAHRALADALGHDDPDRHAWHLASAAEGPDDGLAQALQEVGFRAEQRGGYDTAAAAHQRAAELTADDAARAGRLFAAARNAWAAGQAIRAAALASSARGLAEDVVLRTDIDRLRGRIEVNVGSAIDARRIFLQAANDVAEEDPVRALELEVAASVMRTYGVAGSGSPESNPLAFALEPHDPPRTRCLKQLLAATRLTATRSWSPALKTLQAALETARDLDDLDLLGNLGNAALNLGDDESAGRFYAAMLSGARERGAGTSVVYALQRLAFTQLLAGAWTDLAGSAAEALALARTMAQPALGAAPLAWLTLLAALQGTDEYEHRLTELEHVTARHPLGILTDPVHDLTRWAKATRATSNGDAATAVHHLARMRLPALTRMAALDRIGAAIRAGDPVRAAGWVDELAPFAEATGWPWALAALAHGRALTVARGERSGRFEDALAHAHGAQRPYDEARTQLAYGEHLRRSQHRVDARPHLRSALETFADLNAEPMLEHAAQELRASGETARKRDPSTRSQLTPMEVKVVRLVSSGMSNKDIAAQCWVSPRTVEFHLRNVFTKAGVSSRAQVAQLGLG